MNDGIRRELSLSQCISRYSSEELGSGAMMVMVDIQHAYKNVPVSPFGRLTPTIIWVLLCTKNPPKRRSRMVHPLHFLTCIIPFLGITLDSIKVEVRLPEDVSIILWLIVFHTSYAGIQRVAPPHPPGEPIFHSNSSSPEDTPLSGPPGFAITCLEETASGLIRDSLTVSLQWTSQAAQK